MSLFFVCLPFLEFKGRDIENFWTESMSSTVKMGFSESGLRQPRTGKLPENLVLQIANRKRFEIAERKSQEFPPKSCFGRLKIADPNRAICDLNLCSNRLWSRNTYLLHNKVNTLSCSEMVHTVSNRDLRFAIRITNRNRIARFRALSPKREIRKNCYKKRRLVHKTFVHNFGILNPPSQPTNWWISFWACVQKNLEQYCEHLESFLRTLLRTLLKTLLKTLLPSKAHCKTPSKNPS